MVQQWKNTVGMKNDIVIEYSVTQENIKKGKNELNVYNYSFIARWYNYSWYYFHFLYFLKYLQINMYYFCNQKLFKNIKDIFG